MWLFNIKYLEVVLLLLLVSIVYHNINNIVYN